MKRALINTTWAKDAAGRNVPQLGIDFPGWTIEDWTGQPAENITPSPNLYVVRLTCDEATLAAIEAHPDYGLGAIISEETVTNEAG